MLTARRMAGLALLVTLGACDDPTLGPASPPPYLLVEKGPYQSLYGPDGKIERLVYDRNGDGTADAVIFYGPDGKVLRAEIDSDLDKLVDRWEYFENGVFVRVGYSRSRAGQPDYWDVLDTKGAVTRREYDDDGDGRPDRSEPKP